MTDLYSERPNTQTNRLISHLRRRRATVEGQVHSEIPLPRVCLSRRRDDAAKHNLSHHEQGSQLGFFLFFCFFFCFCFSFFPAVSVSAERRDRVTNTWTFGAICRVYRNWILEPLQAALCPHSAFFMSASSTPLIVRNGAPEVLTSGRPGSVNTLTTASRSVTSRQLPAQRPL